MNEILKVLREKLSNVNYEKATKEVNESFYEGMAFAYGDTIRFIEEYTKCTISNTEILRNEAMNMRSHIETMEKDNMRMRKLLEAINVLTRGE